jgi:hypothetical protein
MGRFVELKSVRIVRQCEFRFTPAAKDLKPESKKAGTRPAFLEKF